MSHSPLSSLLIPAFLPRHNPGLWPAFMPPPFRGMGESLMDRNEAVNLGVPSASLQIPLPDCALSKGHPACRMPSHVTRSAFNHNGCVCLVTDGITITGSLTQASAPWVYAQDKSQALRKSGRLLCPREKEDGPGAQMQQAG